MSYCNLDEAYDNPLTQKIKEYEKANNIKKQKMKLINDIEQDQINNNILPPHNNSHINYDDEWHNVYDTQYGSPNYKPKPKPTFNHSYINAQGDYSKNNYQYGTPINDIRKKVIPELKELNDNDKPNETNDTELSQPFDNFVYDSSMPEDTLSFLDSTKTISDIDKYESKPSTPKNKSTSKPNKYSHKYCINKFVNNLVDDRSDIYSVTSSTSDSVNKDE
jgi:hypothetical protein